jgi:hypothetical protein
MTKRQTSIQINVLYLNNSRIASGENQYRYTVKPISNGTCILQKPVYSTEFLWSGKYGVQNNIKPFVINRHCLTWNRKQEQDFNGK